MQTVVQNPPTSSELHKLHGARPLFAEELRTRIEAGARCVRFEYSFSLLIVTVRRQSGVYVTNSWQERYLRGLWFSFLALFLGPWGVPWGLVWTVWALWVNTTGGVDCTTEVLAELESCSAVLTTAQQDSQHRAVAPLL